MSFDPTHLASLAAVLRQGAFDLAAAELGVTPSAISQRIKLLEEQVGAPLVLRGTPCSGTPAGLRLAKHAEELGVLEAQVIRDLGLTDTAAPARLRLAVNADSLATWFVDALAHVPGLLFELVIDDQDHSAGWLRRGDVSAAVTASGKPAPGCDRRALGSLRYIATASPAFMADWMPNGPTAEALSNAPCMIFNVKDQLQSRWIEQATGQKLRPPCHMLPSTHAFVDAALAGIGWGMNPETLVRTHIAEGRLVPLDADLPLDVPLDWQVSRSMATALIPLSRSVMAAAGRHLQP
jgi:LysR family transcriptional regulator (chromosome initiation inhibitor)